MLEVDAVTVVTAPKITPQDAKRAGFLSVDALLGYLTELGPLDDDSPLYRIELHHGGDGDRVPLALVDRLDAADVESIGAALSRLDKQAPWSCRTLALIDAFPRVAASELAARAGRKTASFKADVCKLKKLGLTQSFEVGYELAPRGRAYVDAASLARRP